jgi:hypothetical protein
LCLVTSIAQFQWSIRELVKAVFASVVGLCVFSFMVFFRKYFEKISIIILKRKSSILVQLVDYEKLIDQESEYNFPK